MRFDRHLMIGCVAVLALAFATAPASAASQHPGHDKVVAAIKADQAAAVERLRAWIALPTIANMAVNTPQGAEYMRQLALDAGFQQARVVESGGVGWRHEDTGNQQDHGSDLCGRSPSVLSLDGRGLR